MIVHVDGRGTSKVERCKLPGEGVTIDAALGGGTGGGGSRDFVRMRRVAGAASGIRLLSVCDLPAHRELVIRALVASAVDGDRIRQLSVRAVADLALLLHLDSRRARTHQQETGDQYQRGLAWDS